VAQLSQGISYWYPHQIPQIAIDILNVPLSRGDIFVPQNPLNSLSIWSPIDRRAIQRGYEKGPGISTTNRYYVPRIPKKSLGEAY